MWQRNRTGLNVKTKMEILSNFVTLSENLNFKINVFLVGTLKLLQNTG